MSKKLTLVLKDQDVEVQDFNGTFYIYRQSTEKDFRGQVQRSEAEKLLTLSPEEASLLADAINQVLGKGVPLTPIERTPTPATETTSSDATSSNG